MFSQNNFLLLVTSLILFFFLLSYFNYLFGIRNVIFSFSTSHEYYSLLFDTKNNEVQVPCFKVAEAILLNIIIQAMS